ncbi:PIG-L family deacetylase [Robertkochia solimangrovi]|uniref:PIG-L family deacetylase n=1 Tax=Robertkochia solimangrovi TaxID=2213046 RepID=UPI0011805F45|nr:PIG-L family deacetylase [Robertkochia solimangrovi]TRZ43474.1 LmbE family protein [Robertkochia solimangrovi]
MNKLLVFLFCTLCSAAFLNAQRPEAQSSAEIYQSIKKLNFLGTALYLAAHPDDENTRLISYLSNELHARTAYLSLTRGDGGQNLIGPELRELLGVLRTQELLAARRVDGGEQFFTRANDFGYSKHSDETLEIWNKDSVLADVVKVIRTFQPDVIINRFDHRTPGTTHGHHTSSAILSYEAFDLAGNKSVYPQQLTSLDPWQPKRLFFNTSYWFYGSREKFEAADKSKLLSFPTGVYYPSLGESNNEIASVASSQHLSQGFGRMTSRGEETEYIELLKGDMPEENDLFSGINTKWTRVEGGQEILNLLKPIEENFNFKDPSVHIPDLMKAYELIQGLNNEYWKNYKSHEIQEIILQCGGILLEAVANEHAAVPSDSLHIAAEALNRSNLNVRLLSLSLQPEGTTWLIASPLENNKENSFDLDTKISGGTGYSGPYWLREKATLGMYHAKSEYIGLAETPAPLQVTFQLAIDGKPLKITRNVIHKFAKPDKGEIYEPFEILPAVTASITNKVNLFTNDRAKFVPVVLTAGKNEIAGTVSLDLPEGWKSEPEISNFNIANKGDIETITFRVIPPAAESEGTIRPVVQMQYSSFDKELVTINYEHIPRQSVLMPSEAKVVRLDIKKSGEYIGYINGAGDEVAESLRQIGYKVVIIEPEDINATNLQRFDAVVVGIRAYNVLDNLKFKQHYLFDYVKEGGNLIVQYNTAGRRDPGLSNLAPYELSLSNDRVTDENSKVKILDKKSSLINFPNQITDKDFEGWVQERGLYFPDQWGPEFTPVLSMHDKDESPKEGSLLVAPYGKGHYIYTGLSFFRELPAGVPGAFKIFANMLSVGREETPKEKIKG